MMCRSLTTLGLRVFGPLTLLLGVVLVSRGECTTDDAAPACLEQLRKLSRCQIEELFTHAAVGEPFVGSGRGRVLLVVDERLPSVKRCLQNAVWRGKEAEADGHFVNRWIGGIRKIESQYVVGPSWFDGKPALIMEYAPGTPLLANTHDELREIAPGLYIGPLYDRCPCPRLRSFIALQVECGPNR